MSLKAVLSIEQYVTTNKDKRTLKAFTNVSALLYAWGLSWYEKMKISMIKSNKIK